MTAVARRLLIALVPLIVACPAARPVPADGAGGGGLPPVPGPEVVSRRLAGSDGSTWEARFRAGFDGREVRLRLRLNLVAGPEVSAMALQRAREAWEGPVEAIWSDRVALVAPEGARYPVRLDLEFSGHPADRDVIVTARASRPHAFDWHVHAPPALVAHEVGHQLGAYDDYAGGANDPAGRPEDPGSVMALGGRGGGVRPRHLHVVRDWLAERTGVAGLRLVEDGGR